MDDIEFIEGDLLDFASPFAFIGHQCNCFSKTPKHLSEQVFSKYPHANIYKANIERKPGNIIVKSPVVNLLAQRRPGKAWGIEGERYIQRREWLQQCFNKVFEQKEIKTIYLPYGIGCGAAGDNWEKVLPIVKDFKNKMENENRNVIFVKKN